MRVKDVCTLCMCGIIVCMVWVVCVYVSMHANQVELRGPISFALAQTLLSCKTFSVTLPPRSQLISLPWKTPMILIHLGALALFSSHPYFLSMDLAFTHFTHLALGTLYPPFLHHPLHST